MTNFKLTVEYDGTDFYGWQRQNGLRTVQGAIENALAQIFQSPVSVYGAGRTDAGVHAWGQVCNFRAETRLEPGRVGLAITSQLPQDVAITAVEKVPDDFHARFSAVWRRYEYTVSTIDTAIRHRFVRVVRRPLDVSAMRRAIAYLEGQHDFTSFTPAMVEGVSPVCSFHEVRVDTDGPLILFRIRADRFLQHMVRVIVGTLLEVGWGRTSPERIPAIMRKRDRRAAGPTAPPRGLALVEVGYP